MLHDPDGKDMVAVYRHPVCLFLQLNSLFFPPVHNNPSLIVFIWLVFILSNDKLDVSEKNVRQSWRERKHSN